MRPTAARTPMLLLAFLLPLADALHVSALPRRSLVSMGLFDSIKNAIDDIEASSGRKSAYASHILVKKQSDAIQIKEKLDAGEITFSDAARQYSTCPSAGKGGSLGNFGPGEMARPFDALVFDADTQLGELYMCSTAYGTHIVQVLERTGVEQTPPAELLAKASAAEAERAPLIRDRRFGEDRAARGDRGLKRVLRHVAVRSLSVRE